VQISAEHVSAIVCSSGYTVTSITLTLFLYPERTKFPAYDLPFPELDCTKNLSVVTNVLRRLFVYARLVLGTNVHARTDEQSLLFNLLFFFWLHGLSTNGHSQCEKQIRPRSSTILSNWSVFHVVVLMNLINALADILAAVAAKALKYTEPG
jgi:hypothetical protein